MNAQSFKVISFRRWSSRLQTDGDSDRRQLQAALDYCATKGWRLDEQIIDPGKSAYHGLHITGGSLGRFFERVKAGDIRPGDILLFEGWDRFSRQPPDIALPLFFDLMKGGIAIHTTFDSQVYTKESIRSNQGQLYSTLLYMWAAHSESRTKGMRIRQAWTKRRNSRTHVCPAWVRPSADGTIYICIPERVAVIERIYRLAIAGHGVESICRVLNREHVPGFGRDSEGWHHSYVRTLLTDRRVLGEAEFREWKTDDDGKTTRTKTGERRKLYPAAVPDELWQQAQDNRRRDNPGGNGANMTNLLGSGLSKCSCGATMTLVRKGAQNTYMYMQCSDARRGKDCSHKKLHRYEPIEQFVLMFFGQMAHGGVATDDAATSLRAKRDIVQRQADDIEQQYNRLAEAIGQGGGALAAKRLAALEAEHTKVLAQVADYDSELVSVQARPVAERLAELQGLISELDSLPPIERVALRSRINRGLASFVDHVVFNDQNPPKVATRPAELVEASEWYIRFTDTFPTSILHGNMAWMVAMAQALEQGNVTVKDGVMLAKVQV